MAQRNNRSSYHQPTPAEVDQIRKDPLNVPWVCMWKMASRLTGRTDLHFAEVHDLLKLQHTDHVMLHGKPVWGWWKV